MGLSLTSTFCGSRYGSVQLASPFSFVVDSKLPKSAHIELVLASQADLQDRRQFIHEAGHEVEPQPLLPL